MKVLFKQCLSIDTLNKQYLRPEGSIIICKPNKIEYHSANLIRSLRTKYFSEKFSYSFDEKW